MRKYEKILIEIRRKDPFALEVSSEISLELLPELYKVSHKQDREENLEKKSYEKSYDHFCKSIVDVRAV